MTTRPCVSVAARIKNSVPVEHCRLSHPGIIKFRSRLNAVASPIPSNHHRVRLLPLIYKIRDFKISSPRSFIQKKRRFKFQKKNKVLKYHIPIEKIEKNDALKLSRRVKVTAERVFPYF